MHVRVVFVYVCVCVCKVRVMHRKPRWVSQNTWWTLKIALANKCKSSTLYWTTWTKIFTLITSCFNSILSSITKLSQPHELSCSKSTTETPDVFSSETRHCCEGMAKTIKSQGEILMLQWKVRAFQHERKQVLLSSQSLYSLPAVEEVNARNLVFRVKIWLIGR